MSGAGIFEYISKLKVMAITMRFDHSKGRE